MTKTQIKKRLVIILEHIRDLHCEIEDIIDGVEPYEDNEDLTSQLEERYEWLYELASQLEDVYNSLEEHFY